MNILFSDVKKVHEAAFNYCANKYRLGFTMDAAIQSTVKLYSPLAGDHRYLEEFLTSMLFSSFHLYT